MQTVATNFSRVRSRYQGRAIGLGLRTYTRDSSPRDTSFLSTRYTRLVNCTARLLATCMKREKKKESERAREREKEREREGREREREEEADTHFL